MRYEINLVAIGALTSKPYSFKSRPWELKYLESIDLYDTLGSNIKISYRNSNILRIIPVINENINEEWISDKIRFSYDCIHRWRYTIPLIKDRKQNKYNKFSWKKIFKEIDLLINQNNIKQIDFYTGNYSSLNTLLCTKDLAYQNNNYKLKSINSFDNDIFFNHNISILDFKNIKSNKVYILIGLNLRLDNPILNLKIRKISKQKISLIIHIGNSYNCNYYMNHLGNNLNLFFKLLEGKNFYSKLIKKFLIKSISLNDKINIIIGNNFLKRVDSRNFINSIYNSNLKFKLTRLFNDVGSLNSSLINFNNNISYYNKNTKLIYLLGINFLKKKEITKKNFYLFQGHHNFLLKNKFDIILPSLTFFETNAIHINCLNILQETKGINPYFKEAKENWKIIYFFFKKIYGLNSDISQKNKIKEKIENNIGVTNLNKLNIKSHYLNYIKSKNIFYKTLMKNVIFNYYNTDSQIKASKNMQNCSKEFFTNKNTYLWN